MLECAIDELTEFSESDGVDVDRRAAIMDFVSELETAKDEAEGVEFPGMY